MLRLWRSFRWNPWRNSRSISRWNIGKKNLEEQFLSQLFLAIVLEELSENLKTLRNLRIIFRKIERISGFFFKHPQWNTMEKYSGQMREKNFRWNAWDFQEEFFEEFSKQFVEKNFLDISSEKSDAFFSKNLWNIFERHLEEISEIFNEFSNESWIEFLEKCLEEFSGNILEIFS